MRGYLIALLVAALCPTGASAQQSNTPEILVQVSLTAGLRYHGAKAVWDQMQIGDALDLVREPLNPYDANAVSIEWNGHKLGYIPRTENRAVARQIDRGNRLQARITKLAHYRNHRRKLEIEVYVPLPAGPDSPVRPGSFSDSRSPFALLAVPDPLPRASSPHRVGR